MSPLFWNLETRPCIQSEDVALGQNYEPQYMRVLTTRTYVRPLPR